MITKHFNPFMEKIVIRNIDEEVKFKILSTITKYCIHFMEKIVISDLELKKLNLKCVKFLLLNF